MNVRDLLLATSRNPIASLVRRDPAQSAAIFLTTVTDIVGFASFLGFAVAFSPLLL